jgi:hypothetical protein
MNNCVTCRHWRRDDLNSEGRADCEKLQEVSDDFGEVDDGRFKVAPIVAWPRRGLLVPAETFETKPDFGCSLWEATVPPRRWKTLLDDRIHPGTPP